METGVPVWALDADRLDGALGIRPAGEGERFPAGNLVIADAAGPIAVLFGGTGPPHGVDRHTARVALFSVQVAGVSALHVEEALWQAGEALR
jgi:DNA/RNA-binding domain of Phe-tRNA-synthetase-like protein